MTEEAQVFFSINFVEGNKRVTIPVSGTVCVCRDPGVPYNYNKIITLIKEQCYEAGVPRSMIKANILSFNIIASRQVTSDIHNSWVEESWRQALTT